MRVTAHAFILNQRIVRYLWDLQFKKIYTGFRILLFILFIYVFYTDYILHNKLVNIDRIALCLLCIGPSTLPFRWHKKVGTQVVYETARFIISLN